MMKFLKKTLVYYLVMILLALFLTGPFFWLTFTAAKSGQDVFKLESVKDILPSAPTLENFRRVWTEFDTPGKKENKLLNFFKSTFIIVGAGIILELLVASLAAYPLARMEFKGKNLIFGIMLSTMMLPAQANMIVNFITIRKLGLFDTYLAVVLPSAVSVFGIFLMRQAYLIIPKELEDAARIDGCSELQVWYKVMLPLTKPALATLAIFSFVSFWNSFMWPLVILKSDNLYPLSVGLSFLANTFDSNFRLVAAASVLSMLPVIALFLIMQKQFVAGITAGAVKQ
jgi:putative chitobiose transport system permease protein